MAQSTQGQTFGYGQESALGTGTGNQDIRTEEIPAYPTSTRFGIENHPKGHQHAAKKEKPIYIEKFREGALSFSTKIRSNSGGADAPPIADFFESMGCEIHSNTNPTVVAADGDNDDDKQWTLSADVHGSETGGVCGLIEIDTSGIYYPTLLLDYDASNVCKAAMELPSPGISDGSKYEMMTTITPYARQVPTTKTLTFLHSTRGYYDAGVAEELTYELSGCAGSGVAELTIVPGEAPVMSFTFHVGKVDQVIGGNVLANETFECSQQFAVIDDNFKFEFGIANATTPITRVDKTLFSATITWNISTKPIISEGDGTFAGIQGYMAHIDGPATVSITSLWDYSWWSNYAATTIFGEYEADNTSQYIGLVQPCPEAPTVLNRPGFGFWMPNAHLIATDPATVDFADESVIKGTATFEADCAGFNSETLNSERGAAPWFFAISGVGVAT